MRRYGGGMLYAALPLHMQRDCFRIRTHDQQVTKAQLYRCTRARPQVFSFPIHYSSKNKCTPYVYSWSGHDLKNAFVFSIAHIPI